jgi:hypothetical protein
MNKKITFLTIILLLHSSFSFVMADYGGVTLSSWTDNPPTKEGVMTPREWDKADFSEFATDHEPPVNGTLYVE